MVRKHLIFCDINISFSPKDGGDVAIGTASGEIHFFSVYDEGKSYRMVASVQVCLFIYLFYPVNFYVLPYM